MDARINVQISRRLSPKLGFGSRVKTRAKVTQFSYHCIQPTSNASSYRGISMRRIAIFVLTTLAAFTASMEAASTYAAERRPNIILILSDDVGLGDIHYCGGPFNTPSIDKLAESGTKFTYCYATPLCGPSRCELLTGRYPFRTGLISNHIPTAVDPKHEVMIPSVLKKAGYVTASVGKWGQIQLGPGDWGFDEYLVFTGSGRYWRDQTTYY